ncbi:F-box domain-containing protein/Kelch_1 domain-containing protein [Cephalotus follicularis]|uniref:F-box domain-containing protein/Kelch_1 domain-containing protein n=3 Tax=Cephalotus follicularis TaxID=3775 RepID=A0A1Q3ANR7_CEPFO|nr:F-box domain-containing protein/Kelch_1 domain-containing protein [Cephalotus follicularis]
MSISTSPAPSADLIPSLPNDISLNILARIPRCHHRTLSLVSKAFRSILTSPIFFTTRSLLHTTQHFLYLSLRFPTSPSIHHFYTLRQGPISPKHSLALVPPPPPPPRIGSAFVSLGPHLFVLGGSFNDVSSPHVWTLDCRFHTWEPLPNMRVAREFAAAAAIGNKIYVVGGCVVDTWARSKNWAEVFDTVTEVWDSVPSPVDVKEKWMHASAVIGGKIYAMADRGGVKYEPESGEWDCVESELDMGWRGRGCVIDGVLYCYDYLGNIRGFDVNEGVWKVLRGVEKGLPRFLCGATMVNLGGKLLVVWEGKGGGGGGKEMEIWCAMIETEKGRDDGELWGKIQWVDVVLNVPNGSSIVHCSTVMF